MSETVAGETGELEPGTLWPRVRGVTARALASGALQPIATDLAVVEEQGIPFLVRTLAGAAGRVAEAGKQASANVSRPPDAPPPPRDPFLPYDPALWVADLGKDHVCLLNKYNVIDHHLLVVTRVYEEQDAPLTLADFAALARCMAEMDGLAFYNGGKIAGASQRHKHLQLAPWPWRGLPDEPPGAPPGAPIDVAMLAGLTATPQVRDWPFMHAALRLPEERTQGDVHALQAGYWALLRALGLDRVDTAAMLPAYNWLATRRWMAVVPRRRGAVDGVEVNGLGFAGSLLVRTSSLLDHVRAAGPLSILRAVAGTDGAPGVHTAR